MKTYFNAYDNVYSVENSESTTRIIFIKLFPEIYWLLQYCIGEEKNNLQIML